ncbi:MAG: diacylglycerol kinase family protein [Oscillospiraceae bacterium]|nr:diacylglycerol kinase family protein [Oscillospiraceae bacterium]
MKQKNILLFNPYSRNDRGEQAAKELMLKLGKGDVRMVDMTAITDYNTFFRQLDDNSRVIICGGDGTLNRFLADTEGVLLPASLSYYAAGSGNDFWKDIGRKDGDDPVVLAPYIKRLPKVVINGQTRRFINGVGCGLDGRCCEVADKTRARGFNKIPYAFIAFLGLLYMYKPTGAEITVDGVTKRYDRAWLVSVMNGKGFGGGVNITPNQDRSDEAGELSSIVVSGCGRLRIMRLFPTIFSGKHLKYTDLVHIVKGHEITMCFDEPACAQIDGETFMGITELTAYSAGSGK